MASKLGQIDDSESEVHLDFAVREANTSQPAKIKGSFQVVSARHHYRVSSRYALRNDFPTKEY